MTGDCTDEVALDTKKNAFQRRRRFCRGVARLHRWSWLGARGGCAACTCRGRLCVLRSDAPSPSRHSSYICPTFSSTLKWAWGAENPKCVWLSPLHSSFIGLQGRRRDVCALLSACRVTLSSGAQHAPMLVRCSGTLSCCLTRKSLKTRTLPRHSAQQQQQQQHVTQAVELASITLFSRYLPAKPTSARWCSLLRTVGIDYPSCGCCGVVAPRPHHCASRLGFHM